MEFKKVLSLLIKNFDREDVRYGLMGGFSLAMLGIPRTTVDLDFLVHEGDFKKIDKIMKIMSYKLVFKTENVSQYVGKALSLGEVDFVHAFRKYSKKMLKRAQVRKIDDLTIKVLCPEDIIGLKIQAMINDPTRKNRELADIESILDKYKDKIDWGLLNEYFHLFGLDKDFNILIKRYGDIDKGR
ncbi:nucleotidyltransferase [candidate division WOR-3 bacterium]|nr:nucleotidyltransferase [candidate division WOR-3 bacterium]